MARIRTIKPEFFLHEELAELPPLHRLLFIGLWTLADRHGRLQDRPKRIKAEVLPYDSADVARMLDRLSEAGFIVRYQVGVGSEGRFIAIPGFATHQRINGREANADTRIPPPPSDLPDPPTPRSTTDDDGKHHGSTTEAPTPDHGSDGDHRKGREGKGREGREHALPVASPIAPVVMRRRLDVVHESAIGIDVTERMHQQFLAQLQNVRVANADTVLRAFYHQTEQTWRGKPTGKPWPFWEARVEELVKHKHRPASSGPFAWRCKHCGQPHEVARREDYATFRCPSLTEVAS
jgi:hypothetical protein